MAEEQVVPQDWKLVLAQKRFEYRTETLPGRDPIALKQEILDLIKEHDAAPMYEFVCEELDWTPDAGELERLQSAVRAQLDKFEESLKEAEENAGEVEIRDALASKALYLADIGDASAAEPALELARSKTAGASQKLDLTFASLRLNMSLGRWQAVVDTLKSSSTWTRGSIDWERRNKLKVYEAMSAIATRRLEAASALLLDCVVTFSATELMPYQRLVLLTCLCSTLSLSRPERKARVVDCPEIVAALPDLPAVGALVQSLHACDYGAFFRALDALAPALDGDMLLAPHAATLRRRLRTLAYAQYLEPYRAVRLAAMAAAFGVSAPFMDRQLADAIAGGRLEAKIDRVGGVVVTNRPDAKSALYAQTIKVGDALLSRVQNLSKVIDIE